MSLGTTLRVGFALLGLTTAGACAQRELDKKPELAQEHGYFVSEDEARARGGVAGYVDVPSNSERASLDQTQQQAGVAANDNTVAESAPPAPAEQPKKSDTVAALKDEPKTILFDLGDSTIKDESKPLLDNIASQMTQAPDATVKVEGFADKIGTHEANKELSEARADSVKEYLQSKGASSDNLDVAFYGDSKAQNPNGDPQDRKVVISLG